MAGGRWLRIRVSYSRVRQRQMLHGQLCGASSSIINFQNDAFFLRLAGLPCCHNHMTPVCQIKTQLLQLSVLKLIAGLFLLVSVRFAAASDHTNSALVNYLLPAAQVRLPPPAPVFKPAFCGSGHQHRRWAGTVGIVLPRPSPRRRSRLKPT